MTKQSNKAKYDALALSYAEHYGILTYKVSGNLMIYNQNYQNNEFIGGRWQANPYTYQRTVNLDTMEVTTKKLQRMNKNGWDNV